ncbi:efflux RND transporter periplasmic adaptor subunit [Aureibacter tunicatorum]|nr:efflux RND transporter periplasmic adaptor subunit [Aureibacter tunicatorum]
MAVAACHGNKKKEEKKQVFYQDTIPVNVLVADTSSFFFEKRFAGQALGIHQTELRSLLNDRVEQVLVKVGDRVRKGQELLVFASDFGDANLIKAKAAFEYAQTKYERDSKLFADGAISEQSYDQSRENMLETKSAYLIAQNAIYMRAPFQGEVLSLDVRVGDFVNSGTGLLKLANLDSLRVVFYPDIESVGLMSVGDSLDIFQNNKQTKGKIYTIGKDLTQNNLVKVETRVPNVIGALANQQVQIIMNLRSHGDDLYSVPKNAIKGQKGDNGVYIVKSSKADFRPIDIINSNDSIASVKGLKKGDSVVVKGGGRLQEGKRVKIIKVVSL